MYVVYLDLTGNNVKSYHEKPCLLRICHDKNMWIHNTHIVFSMYHDHNTQKIFHYELHMYAHHQIKCGK